MRNEPEIISAYFPPPGHMYFYEIVKALSERNLEHMSFSLLMINRC